MPLERGSKLGPYEIVAPLGAGGMGEVYRARDTRLKREVALKILPQEVAYDPDRRERFEQEARAVAALNHPNIVAIYDIGSEGDTLYIVTELVDGEPLSGMKLNLRRTLDTAVQIADGLAAAHAAGVTHRDLKPDNVMMTADGRAKILDFGLAKVTRPIPTDGTTVKELTEPGAVMGTIGYMSPEQVQGQAADYRTDIFSFGVILYELLGGRRAFHRETAVETMWAILKEDPPELPESIPPAVRQVVSHCLEKEPKNRFQSARDLSFALSAMAQSSSGTGVQNGVAPALPGPSPWRKQAVIAVAASLAAVAAALSLIHFREKPAPAAEPVQFRIRLPDTVTFSRSGTFILSPDGRRVAFSGGSEGKYGVWIQDMNTDSAHLLPDTQTGPEAPPFFWSPDGRYVVFSASGSKLRKADVERGISEDICDRPGPPIGGDWNRDGIIIFGSNTSGLWRVPASGGTAVPLTTLDPSRQEIQHELPFFLPDGVRFLYFANSRDASQSAIYAGSLDAPSGEKPTRLVPAAGPESARLLYMHGQMIQVQDFDTARLELRGEPLPLSARVGSVYQTGYFSATRNLLLYRATGAAPKQQLAMVAVDSGKVLETAGEPGQLSSPRLSPDGSRVAYRRQTGEQKDEDIWIFDITSGASSRLTLGKGSSGDPVWSPDGREIAFSNVQGKSMQIYRKRADGTDEPQVMVQSNEAAAPGDWSRDGKFLLYLTDRIRSGPFHDVWILPLEKGGRAFPFAQSRFDEYDARFSPDGRWIAYVSNETGRSEVYVRGFSGSENPGDTGKWTISRDGGAQPEWRADGKEIMWINPRIHAFVAADINTSHDFHAGLPHTLPPRFANSSASSLTADFKKSLMVLTAPNDETKDAQFFDVMVNWTSALKKQ